MTSNVGEWPHKSTKSIDNDVADPVAHPSNVWPFVLISVYVAILLKPKVVDEDWSNSLLDSIESNSNSAWKQHVSIEVEILFSLYWLWCLSVVSHLYS